MLRKAWVCLQWGPGAAVGTMGCRLGRELALRAEHFRLPPEGPACPGLPLPSAGHGRGVRAMWGVLQAPPGRWFEAELFFV